MTESRGSLATSEREPRPTPAAGGRGRRGGPGLIYRQVVSELRKVIWPTRGELVTYTAAALIFVTIMVAIVAVFDIFFAKGVLTVFG